MQVLLFVPERRRFHVNPTSFFRIFGVPFPRAKCFAEKGWRHLGKGELAIGFGVMLGIRASGYVKGNVAVNTTPRGLEPLRAEPNGFRVHLLNHSDTVSSELCCPKIIDFT